MITDRLALNRVPEGDRAVGSASHDLSSLGRPSDCPNLLLTHQGRVQLS